MPSVLVNPGLTKIPDTYRPAEARHAARSKRDSAALRLPRPPRNPAGELPHPETGRRETPIGEASQHFKLFRYSFCSALMR